MDQILETTDKFWDCECKKNFIHHKLDEECEICGAKQEEQPDSRKDEVLKNFFVTPKIFFDKVIRPQLIKMAIDDTLPCDMTEISYYDFI